MRAVLNKGENLGDFFCLRGLTFSWRRCNGLCLRYKPTELAHFFFYSVLVSVSAVMAISTVFHSKILQTILRFLILFFWSYLCLIGPFNYISLCESLRQP